MKRYLVQLTALSLLALSTGCQKEQGEINNPQNNQSVAVNISIDGLSIDAAASPAAGDAATTRAVVEDITDITTHGFTIAGYYTEGGVAPDPVTDGGFDANIAKTKPNVFDYEGGSTYTGDAVLVPELRDGKYEVVLSKWQLRENSCLSYVAWASKVAPGENATVVDNPITAATKNDVVGSPYITVNSGTTSKSFNADVVAAKSIDNVNDVVRSAVDLNFKHVMTKLKFSVKNNSRAAMTLKGARILFAEGKVARKATYTFDGTLSRVGTWGTYDTNVEATYPITLTTTNLVAMGAAVPLEELLIIPQALDAGAISVELTYTMPNGAGASTSTYKRIVPLKAKTFEQNTSYTYEIALSETTISINEGRIGAWMDVSSDLPYVPGLRDVNVPLLLDGYDAPYTHTDGSQYWLDRSGWNRHCKLVGGVTYDATGKFYKFTDSPAKESYVEVPTTFPITTDATFETIVRSTRPTNEDGSQSLFTFINAATGRVMFTHFHYKGTQDYYFDAGSINGSTTYSRVSSWIPTSLYREFAMYAFAKGPTVQSVRRNLLYMNNTISGSAGAVNLATVTDAKIGSGLKGDIKYFKITTTAKTTIDADDYADLSKRHRVKNTDYIDDGLLFDLRGIDAPVDGKWYDRVTGASVPTSGLSHSTNYKEYYIDNTVEFNVAKNYAGTTLPELTIEFVAWFNGFKNGSLEEPLSWTHIGGFRFHENANSWQWLSPDVYSKAFARVYENTVSLGKDKHSFSCTRKNLTGNQVELFSFRGNRQVASASPNAGGIMTEPPTSFKLTGSARNGCLVLSSSRLYNRKLTGDERTWNYNLDKLIYISIQ